MNPKVTVLMSCKNSNPELLSASIGSVLNQTFKDFEFVIVDDGSDAPLETIVKGITDDERVRVLRIEPSGLGAALTYGIKHSVGEYIARIDDDDLMSSKRLEIQVEYLDKHKDVSCVGSQRYSYCSNKYIKHKKFPLDHETILRSTLAQKWCMAHTAMMYRKESVIRAGYYRIKGTGEDVDLILQLSTVGKLANLDDYLLYYNLNMNSLSAKNSQLPGHKYAFEEYSKITDNAIYQEIIAASLKDIDNKLHDMKPHFLWKKWILVNYIRLFGKKLPNTL